MTDKHAYNTNKDVRDFAQWVVKHAATLPISLNFRSSRAVPGGMQKMVGGLPGTLANYVWTSEGNPKGDWAGTARLLSQFRFDLNAAIAATDDAAAFIVCAAIIVWGGNRNPQVGATPFLHELASKKSCSPISPAPVRTLNLIPPRWRAS